MGHLSITVRRGDTDADDRVKLTLTEPFVFLTSTQAREVAKELAAFADSADPDIPYVRVPVISSCKAEGTELRWYGRMNRYDTEGE